MDFGEDYSCSSRPQIVGAKFSEKDRRSEVLGKELKWCALDIEGSGRWWCCPLLRDREWKYSHETVVLPRCVSITTKTTIQQVPPFLSW